jgi:hypothetical protein
MQRLECHAPDAPLHDRGQTIHQVGIRVCSHGSGVLGLGSRGGYSAILFNSSACSRMAGHFAAPAPLRKVLQRVAPTGAVVLLTGEHGTERANQCIPINAIRKDAPIVGGCREKNPDNRSTFER